MRTLVVTAVTVGVLVLTGACAAGGDSGGSADRQSNGSTASPRQDKSPPPPPSGEASVVDSPACDEVRAGIDAFNVGEFDETVERFRVALPLAEDQDDGSVLASQLIEAVRYYAELDAQLYLDASESSPEFAKYKAITLGQCMGGDDQTPEPPGAEI